MSLAQHIKQDVASRLDGGDTFADSLTLEGLARHYRVSLTPVRTAVSELIAEGVLKRSAGRRLVIRRRPRRSRTSQQPPPLPASFDDHYATVSRDLVEQSLQGKPVVLREEATAQRYGVSRATIRQIFHRLVGDGLLEHLPRRGWRLRPLRREDLDAYIEFRVAAERTALELGKHRLEETDLRTMLAANRLPKKATEQPRPDGRLHAYLVEKSGNPYIADFFARHGKYYETLFAWEALDRAAALQAIRHHRAILEALIARDWNAAGDRLEEHIRTNHPVLQQLLASQQEDPS